MLRVAFFAAVDEGSGGEAFGGDEGLGVELVAVRVSEDDGGQWCSSVGGEWGRLSVNCLTFKVACRPPSLHRSPRVQRRITHDLQGSGVQCKPA